MLMSTLLPAAQLTTLQQFSVNLSQDDLSLLSGSRRCPNSFRDRTSEAARMLLKLKPEAPIHPAAAFTEPFWNAQHPPSPEFDLKIC